MIDRVQQILSGRTGSSTLVEVAVLGLYIAKQPHDWSPSQVLLLFALELALCFLLRRAKNKREEN